MRSFSFSSQGIINLSGLSNNNDSGFGKPRRPRIDQPVPQDPARYQEITDNYFSHSALVMASMQSLFVALLPPTKPSVNPARYQKITDNYFSHSALVMASTQSLFVALLPPTKPSVN